MWFDQRNLMARIDLISWWLMLQRLDPAGPHVGLESKLRDPAEALLGLRSRLMKIQSGGDFSKSRVSHKLRGDVVDRR